MANALPTVTPYLYYSDVGAAISWLTRAFGWTETSRASGADGQPFHAELAVASDAAILIGCPGPGYRNPRQLGQTTQSLYMRVSNVDEIFARASAAGAAIIEVPADQVYGDRRCGVEDCEGHCWYFAQPLKG